MNRTTQLRYFYFFLLSLFGVNVAAQELERKNIIKDALAYCEYKDKEQANDSLSALALKISRASKVNTIPFYESLDSVVKNKTLKLTFYLQWATTVSRQGDVTTSRKLRKRALAIAEEEEEIEYQFDYLNSLSSFYVSLNKPDSVSFYNIKADRLLKQYPEALRYGSWQIEYRNSKIQELLGNTDEQKKALERSWQTVKDFKNHSNKGFLIYVLLDFYRQTNDDVNQAKFTEHFITHYKQKKLNTPDYHFPIESILLKDDSPASISNLIRINILSDSLNNLNSLSQTTVTLASKFIENNRAKEAIPYLKNSIQKLAAAKYPISNSSELNLLQRAYHSVGDYKNAYKVLSQQKTMEDSLRSIEMLNKIADYEVKYESEKKDAELLKLNFEAQKTKQQQKTYAISFVFGTLILIILSFFFYKNKKQNQILAKQKKMLEITVDEKNVLLKETHHRVKNSFQIVSSLLYLQSENLKDKDAQDAMKEAQNRVRSMVLIHQRLYSKDQLVGISIDEYLMDLVKDVFESHQVETEKITYNIKSIPIVLGIEETTSLGLIVNELITNIIKHAFPQTTAKGLMQVTFQKTNDTLVLQVIDDGVGMSTHIKETSFGIELINALAAKFKAKLIFSKNKPNGTIATVTIHKFKAL